MSDKQQESGQKSNKSRYIWRPNQPTNRVKGSGGAEPCGSKEKCQACSYSKEDYKSSLDTKYQKGLERRREHIDCSGVQIIKPTLSPKPLHYRAHAKLAVRPSKNPEEGRFAVGLFRQNS